MLTWYANSFRHGYRYAHSGHYTPGADTGTPLNFLSLIFSRLPSLGTANVLSVSHRPLSLLMTLLNR